eukprot:1073316-Rhodomonas_salina.1
MTPDHARCRITLGVGGDMQGSCTSCGVPPCSSLPAMAPRFKATAALPRLRSELPVHACALLRVALHSEPSLNAAE